MFTKGAGPRSDFITHRMHQMWFTPADTTLEFPLPLATPQINTMSSSTGKKRQRAQLVTGTTTVLTRSIRQEGLMIGRIKDAFRCIRTTYVHVRKILIAFQGMGLKSSALIVCQA